MTERIPLTVLVVEDEWLIRATIVDCLTEAGFTVIEAASGEMAVALLADGHCIDLVFTDIRLSGTLNGWDVGESARVNRPGIPVIYASGYSIVPPREVVGSMFFDKPYDPAVIVQACRSLAAPR